MLQQPDTAVAARSAPWRGPLGPPCRAVLGDLYVLRKAFRLGHVKKKALYSLDKTCWLKEGFITSA